MRKDILLIALLIGVIVIPLSVFGRGEAEAELTKVRIGIAPYTMFQIWPAAKEFGVDKEFDLDLELVSIAATLPGVQLLVRGDIDISSNCIAEHIAVIQNAPQVKGFSSLGFFKGFFFGITKGTYCDYASSAGNDPVTLKAGPCMENKTVFHTLNFTDYFTLFI